MIGKVEMSEVSDWPNPLRYCKAHVQIYPTYHGKYS